MMNLPVVTSLLIVLAISLQQVEGSRRCWCDARINGRVVKYFGVIASCGGWCGCGNNDINRCGLTCDEKVHDWAATVCLQQYKGKQVRSHFKASTCKTGDGKRTFTCNPPPVCYKKITKRVAYTCYKTVTQTVTTPCSTGSSGRSAVSSSRSAVSSSRSAVSSSRSGVSSARSGVASGRSGVSSARSVVSSGRSGVSSARSGVSSRRLPIALKR